MGRVGSRAVEEEGRKAAAPREARQQSTSTPLAGLEGGEGERREGLADPPPAAGGGRASAAGDEEATRCHDSPKP
jgi:hypothetical protein